MKKLFLLKTGALILFVCSFLFSGASVAQEAKPVASPRDSVSGKIGKANVEINY